MGAKIDPSSSVESRHVQSAVPICTSSTGSVSSPKVSMFGAKSGFVIPKNKLSGSLVPIFRGGKVDAGNTIKEESIKQVQRKTKWGTDLTQDAAVRKGRALAYQTRVEQITQQLKAGALEIGDDQGSQSPKQVSNHDFARDNIDNKYLESLELERREIIGEILRLNPNYKAPPDYRPLLKEAKVPIPVKAYPGNNFIGLLLGPESNTQKRLEEETGAKIRVHGTKANTREKREITPADIHEAQGAYEELYVNVSADTYEKVDAAVALIELLVAPVSGSSAVASTNSSSVAGDNVDPSKESAQSVPPQFQPYPNQGVSHLTFMPAQSGPPQFQPYPSPWYPIAPSNAPSRPPYGFTPAPFRSNPIQFPPSPVGPVNVPQYFRQPPPFGSFPRTSSPAAPRPHLPMQAMQQPQNQPMPPQHHPVPGQQPHPAYPVMRSQPNSTAPAPFSPSQPMFTGSIPASRPPVPMNPQPAPMAPPRNPPVWAIAPQTVQPPLRPNMTQMAPISVNPPARPLQTVTPPRPIASGPTQPNVPNNVPSRPPSVTFATPATFPSRPPSASTFSSVPPQIRPVSAPPMVSSSPLRAPVPAPTPIAPTMPSPASRPFPLSAPPPTTVPAPVPSVSAPIFTQVSVPSQSAAPVMMSRPPGPIQSPAPGQAPRPTQLPPQAPQPPPSVSGSSLGTMPGFAPVKPVSSNPTTPITVPTITAPRPLRPSSGDFTFQPLRAQVPASPTTPRSNSPSVVQNTSQVPLAAPQAPSFRPALQNPAPAVGAQRFPWPSAPVPSRAPVPPPSSTVPPFSANPTGIRPPPRLPFPSPNPGPPMAPATQMGPPSFSPAPRPPNLSGPMPPRPANLLQPHPNQLPPTNRPVGITIPNQQSGSTPFGFAAGRPSPSPGGNQIYDPFSPSSISTQQGGDPTKQRKPEADAEYEDLMASVGVK